MERIPQKRLSDEIPTSSMADIAFLLIIFFMLTTTFAASRGLDYQLPDDSLDAVDIVPEESVLIEVLPGGALEVDGRPAAIEGLIDMLRPKLTRNPAKPVILQPRPDAEYGSMVAVFDTLRQGHDRLGLDEPIRIALPTQREIEAFWF
ncbi:MAG: biopolymer transporter ExbD [Acidobacteriota bacterium]